MDTFFNKYISKKDRPALLFIITAGTLSHFLYEWTGNAFFALICPVNESVWEHLKLLFFPFLLWSLWCYIRRKTDASLYFYSRLFAVLCGMLSIVTLFYTYTGIIGQHFLVLDILIFIIGTIITLHLIPMFTKYFSFLPSPTVIYAAWIALILCFFVFTCFPPNIPLFFSYA